MGLSGIRHDHGGRILRRRRGFFQTARGLGVTATKAVAMILLAAAAISAAGGLAGHLWPQGAQQIVVRLEQPLAVRVQ